MSSHQLPAPAAPMPPPFGVRLLTGVLGVFVAAMMSGLNSRIGGASLSDLLAVYGLGTDEGSWLNSAYAAAELAAMPFAAWFSVTFSFRRFHIAVVAVFTVLGLLTPLAPSFAWLLLLRGAQGFFGGLLIPLLMAAALRFFPLPIRLYGLALYAMTATFAPNVAIWLSATWTDTLVQWQLLFWQIVPLAVFAMAAVAWGIPQDPVRLERLPQVNGVGLVTGVTGLTALALALSQGERLDWFASPLLCALLLTALPLLLVFLFSEWVHPLPFIKLQLLSRRNLGLGFTIFFGLLIVMLSGALLPLDYLGHHWHLRTPQMAGIGLQIGLPQFVLGPLVSWLLYKRWMDARYMFAAGLVLLGAACAAGWGITAEWMLPEFALAQWLHAFGQPMAVISMLFLATSVVQPLEGPVVSGIVNGLRALGTLFGSAMLGHLLTVREKIHANRLLDAAMGRSEGWLTGPVDATYAQIAHAAKRISEQAFVLAISDGYLVLGVLALIMIPLVLSLQYIAPPVIHNSSK